MALINVNKPDFAFRDHPASLAEALANYINKNHANDPNFKFITERRNPFTKEEWFALKKLTNELNMKVAVGSLGTRSYAHRCPFHQDSFWAPEQVYMQCEMLTDQFIKGRRVGFVDAPVVFLLERDGKRELAAGILKREPKQNGEDSYAIYSSAMYHELQHILGLASYTNDHIFSLEHVRNIIDMSAFLGYVIIHIALERNDALTKVNDLQNGRAASEQSSNNDINALRQKVSGLENQLEQAHRNSQEVLDNYEAVKGNLNDQINSLKRDLNNAHNNNNNNNNCGRGNDDDFNNYNNNNNNGRVGFRNQQSHPDEYRDASEMGVTANPAAGIGLCASFDKARQVIADQFACANLRSILDLKGSNARTFQAQLAFNLLSSFISAAQTSARNMSYSEWANSPIVKHGNALLQVAISATSGIPLVEVSQICVEKGVSGALGLPLDPSEAAAAGAFNARAFDISRNRGGGGGGGGGGSRRGRRGGRGRGGASSRSASRARSQSSGNDSTGQKALNAKNISKH